MARVCILRFRTGDNELSGERQFAAFPIRIGRNSLNDLSIRQHFISDFHARVEELDGKICVRDLGSRNGVLLPTGERIAPQTPVDLAPFGYEFLVGPFVRVKLELTDQAGWAPERADKATGAVLGNQRALAVGMADASAFGPAREPFGAALPAAPAHTARPPAKGEQAPTPGSFGGFGSAPAGPSVHPAANLGGLPDLPNLPNASHKAEAPLGPSGPGAFVPVYGGGPPHAAPAPHSSYVAPAPYVAPAQLSAPPIGTSTQHFEMTAEMLAVLGLRELAASLVPGQPLETTGDMARLITKLHDTLEVFCRSFVPLRDGYAQFVSSMDLRQAASQRTVNRSNGYRNVEYARDPAQVARALLDWRDPSFDAPSAIEGIFADLMVHQVALLDGVMQGVRALLTELSPERIEESVKGGLPLGRHRALWQTYCERFEELSNENQAFTRIFGREFTEVYLEHGRGRSDPSRNR